MASKSDEVSEVRAKKIDFKKYRSPELADSVTDIIDVRGKFVGGLKTMFFSFGAFLLLVGILFWIKGNFATFTLAAGYSIVAGAVFSLVMAIAGVVKRSLSEMEQLVGLLFSTTNQVAQDVSSLGQGDVELPSARELVEGVYGDVLLPAVEQVVAKSLGFVGKPLLFAYRMTLGRIVRKTIKLLPDSALAESSEQLKVKADSIMKDLKSVGSKKSQIDTTLTWAQDHLGALSTKAKFLVLLPCYVIASIIVLAVSIPLVVLYFWF